MAFIVHCDQNHGHPRAGSSLKPEKEEIVKTTAEHSATHILFTPHAMSRPASLITAVALTSGAALNLPFAQSASAMTIAWDCFDRSNNALVARSSIDLTSPSISCLPAAGAPQQTDTSTDQASEPIEISNENTSSDANDFEVDDAFDENDPEGDPDQALNDEELIDEEFTEDNFPDDELAENDQSPEQLEIPSTGDALGEALGNHLGRLLGQGLSDLFR